MLPKPHEDSERMELEDAFLELLQDVSKEDLRNLLVYLRGDDGSIPRLPALLRILDGDSRQ